MIFRPVRPVSPCGPPGHEPARGVHQYVGDSLVEELFGHYGPYHGLDEVVPDVRLRPLAVLGGD
jgi:hypothetical protein